MILRALALVTIASLLAPVPPALAQGVPALGVRVGGSAARFAGEGMSAVDGYRVGATFGVVAVVPLDERLALQSEVTWIPKGGSGTVDRYGDLQPVRLSIDYLQLPVLARWRLPDALGVRPFLFTGPAVSLEMRCRVRTPPDGPALTLGCEAPDGARAPRRRVDWSWLVGASLHVRTGAGTLFLDARADLGLVGLHVAWEAVDMRNRAFALSVGMLLPGGVGP